MSLWSPASLALECVVGWAAEDGVSALLSILRLLGGRAAAGKRLPLVAPERPPHVGE